MKIRTNKAIQNAVDGIAGHKLLKIAVLHKPAVSLEDSSPEDAFLEGVNEGVKLLQEYEKTMIVDLWIEGNKMSRQDFLKSVDKTFGIYIATQDTSEGCDLLYFIGTPKSIVQKIVNAGDN